MHAALNQFWAAIRAVRLGRLAVLLGVAAAAGLACDWFRPEQRLVFSRPLPPFTTTGPTR